MDPKKVEVVVDWLVPKQLEVLWGFLGLTVYHRIFVKNYESMASPLLDLTKKDAFQRTEESQKVFDQLK